MRHAASIPHIVLVPFEAVGLEGVLGVVLLLVRDVGAHVVGFGFDDGEDSVTRLSVKLGDHGIALGLVDEPDGGGALHFFDPIRQGDRAGECMRR